MPWVGDSKPPPPPRTPPKKGGGCCRGTARLWLVVFNLFFALLGAGLIVVGYFLRFESAFFETYILDVMTAAKVDGVDLRSVLQSVSIVLMMLGFIVMVFATIGILGACCSIKMMLTVYALVMLKLIVLEVVGVILLLVLRDDIDAKVKGALQTTLDQYEGYNSTDPLSVGWNFVFYKLDCCGIDDYRDIANSSDSSWNSVTSYQGNPVTLTAPIFCCKISGSFPDVDLPADADCAVSPNSTTSNYMTSCYDAFEDYIMTYRLMLYIAGGLVFLCEVLNIVTAVVVRQGKVADDKADKKHKRKVRAINRKNNKVDQYQ